MKILFIHATAGAGHQKAAEALFFSLRDQGKHQVQMIDILDYTSPFFKKMYRDSYSFLVTKIPGVWGVVFGLLDVSWMYPVMSFGRRIYNHWYSARLREFLIKEKFNVIVTTHFMSNEVVSALKRKKLIQAKLVSVVTDFDVHRIWLGSGVDQYCVASEWTKTKLKTLGVDEAKIKVTGIPTHQKFSQSYDIGTLKEKLGLKKDVFTVLVATGSFGIGPIEEIMLRLNDFQVLVVCGHNKNLYAKLSPQAQADTKVYGLVDNMPELMAVSDVMVTKPGGLSISEALVSHLPMIFFNAIPGQETNNIKVLETYGIGLSHLTIDEIVEALNKFKSSKDLFLTAVKKTKELARPYAVNEILSLVQG